MSRLRRRSRHSSRARAARRHFRRPLFAEQLEDRRLLAAGTVFHNAAFPLDVDGNSILTPMDALRVMNALNRFGPGPLSSAHRLGQGLHSGEAEGGSVPDGAADRLEEGFVDTNGDENLSSNDVLRIVNAFQAEGEGDTVQYTLKTFNAAGTQEISAINVGGTFKLVAFVEDVRMMTDRVGPFAGYLDVRFDSSLASPSSGINRAGSRYTFVPQGSIPRPGFIDIAGGTDSQLLQCDGRDADGNPVPLINDPDCPGPGQHMLWMVQFSATQLGTLVFMGEPTTDPNDPDDANQSPRGDSGVYGSNEPVCPATNPLTGELECMGSMRFVDATIEIVEDIAAVDDNFTVAEDSTAANPANELNVLGNDILNTGSALFLESFTQPANGTVTRRERGPAGPAGDTLVYVPNGNFFSNPPDEFTYTINNGQGAQSTATVSMTVTPINDAPVNTFPGSRSVNEDQTLTLNNAFSVSDPDNNVQGEINVQVTLSVNNGILDVVTDGANVTGDNTDTVVINGLVSQVNNSLSTVRYTPDQHFFGPDTLTMLTSDLGNTGPGQPRTDQDQVSITVNSVNDPPQVMVPGSQVVFFIDTLIFAPPINPITVADVDDTQLNVTLAVGSGTLTAANSGATIQNNGTGNVQINGTIAQINTSLNGLVYDPPNNVVQDVTLTVTANDGEAQAMGSVPIQVVPPTTPFADNDAATMMEDGGTINIDALDGDLAPDDGTNEIIAITQPANGTASIVFDNDFKGVSVNYTVDADFFGIDTFTYTINAFDDQGSPVGDGESTGTITVTVTPKNDQPQINVPGAQQVNEDAALNFGNSITVSDADAPFDTNYQAQVTLSVNNGTLQATQDGAAIQNNSSSTVTITGSINQLNNALNGLIYRPSPNSGADDTLTVAIDDLNNEGNGGGQPHTNQATVAIDVVPQNDDPTISVPADQSFITDLDNVLSIPNGNAIQVADIDAGNSDIQVSVESDDPNSTLTVSNTAALTSVTGNGTTNVTLLGTVAGINAALGTNSLTFRTPDEGTVTITVTANDLGNTGQGGGEDVMATFEAEVFDFIPSEISGRVFIDEDDDGVADPGERLVEGVEVRLTGADFRGLQVNESVFTDRNGRYTFDDVRPGDYTLSEIQPGQLQDGRDALTQILTADGEPNNDQGRVTIGIRGGVFSQNNDFGERGLLGHFAAVFPDILASGQNIQGILMGSDGWAIFLGDSWNGYANARGTVAANGFSANVTAHDGNSDRTANIDITSGRLRVRRGFTPGEHVTLIRGTPDEVFGGNGEAEGEAADALAQARMAAQSGDYQDAVDQVMQQYAVA